MHENPALCRRLYYLAFLPQQTTASFRQLLHSFLIPCQESHSGNSWERVQSPILLILVIVKADLQGH